MGEMPGRGVGEMPDDEITETNEETTEDTELEKLKADLAKAQKALKDVNKESAGRRKRLEELEEAEAKRQEAQLSETERLQRELEAAKAEAAKAASDAREVLVRSAFVAEAAKAGVAHPEDVYLLADRSAVEVGDDGRIGGVAEAVQALVDSGRVPMSGKAPAPRLDGGAGGGERASETARMSAADLAMAQRMGISPERWQAQKADIAKRQNTPGYQENLEAIADAVNKEKT